MPMLLIAIAAIVAFALALGLVVVAIVKLKQGAEPGSPVDEFCGGTEALDEIHTLFDGVYARWNGLGPWEAPLDMPDDERAVWIREDVAAYGLNLTAELRQPTPNGTACMVYGGVMDRLLDDQARVLQRAGLR